MRTAVALTLDHSGQSGHVAPAGRMTGMEPRAVYQLCFLLVLLIGLGCILAGPALDATYPYFQLDGVLSREQLQDDALRERTLEELKRNNRRRDWPFWLLAGV